VGRGGNGERLDAVAGDGDRERVDGGGARGHEPAVVEGLELCVDGIAAGDARDDEGEGEAALGRELGAALEEDG
jgi:hypothetical protein